MSNQDEIELIHAANKEFDRLQVKLDIAVRTLKKIEILIALNLVDKSKISTAYKLSHEALARIEEKNND